MQNWLLQNLSDVLNRELQAELNSCQTNNTVKQEQTQNRDRQYPHKPKNRLATINAEREWCGAIAALEQLLLSEMAASSETHLSGKQGLIFSAPVPLLGNIDLLASFQSAVFTTDVFQANALMPCGQANATAQKDNCVPSPVIKLPLIPQDPISLEQFCLVLTANFGLVVVLGRDAQGLDKFYFSFNPVTIAEIWAVLRSRLVITNYRHLEQLDSLVEQFAPPEPNYRLVTRFSRQLMQFTSQCSTVDTAKAPQVETVNTTAETTTFSSNFTTSKLEMELLQALTHEVRTPLTTIRTLTKLLLKRQQDFKPNVVKRLQTIDRECTEQIERMELIFRAAEMESTPQGKAVELVPFALERVFQQSIPRWQEKAQRRNVDLKFSLPEKLPQIVSDPVMLDTVLTGLIESCTRSLPTGGHLDVKVSTAGDRLKLQVLSQASNLDNPFKSLGQLLTFQPATGCLSLNLDATKNIFQALGGKLTVRQRQEQGKELTIFLPLGNNSQKAQTVAK